MHFCEPCKFETNKTRLFKIHLNTNKHKTRTDTEICGICAYKCDVCNFTTDSERRFLIHRNTRSHRMRSTDLSEFCKCGEGFYSIRTRNFHQKKCAYVEPTPVPVEPTVIPTAVPVSATPTDSFTPTQVLEIVTTLTKTFTDQMGTMGNAITKLSENQGTNHHNTTTNSHNTQNITQNITINNFLKDHCQDAINIEDILAQIKPELDMADVRRLRDQGCVDSISTIVLGAINKLNIFERPIHCTDAKRNKLYVKSEGKWLSDSAAAVKTTESVELVRIGIDRVACRNFTTVSNAVPNDERLSEELTKLVRIVCPPDFDIKSKKIVSNICDAAECGPETRVNAINEKLPTTETIE